MQWRRNKKRRTVCVLLFNEPFTVNVNVISLFHHLLCLVCSFLSPQVGIDCVVQFDSFVAMVKRIQRIKTKTEFGFVWWEEEKLVYQISLKNKVVVFSNFQASALYLKTWDWWFFTKCTQHVYCVHHAPVPWRNHSIKYKGDFSLESKPNSYYIS